MAEVMNPDNFIAGMEKIEDGMRLLANGQMKFCLSEACEMIEALFVRFAPWKVGSRVELILAPKTEGTAWHASRHFLVPGERGAVVSVGFSNNRFQASVVFDNETWIDRYGNEQPVTSKHSYYLSEEYVRLVE